MNDQSPDWTVRSGGRPKARLTAVIADDGCTVRRRYTGGQAGLPTWFAYTVTLGVSVVRSTLPLPTVPSVPVYPMAGARSSQEIVTGLAGSRRITSTLSYTPSSTTASPGATWPRGVT